METTIGIPDGIESEQSARIVEVYGYIQNGDKMRKVVVGKAELIPLPHHEFSSKAVWGEGLPASCRMCGERIKCRLLREDFLELCTGAHPAPKGSIVVYGCVITIGRSTLKPEKIVKPRTEFIKSTALSLLRDDVYIPESALKVPGINGPPAKWEDYSAAPFIDACSDIQYRDEYKPEPEPDLNSYGLRLKKSLKSLLAANPAKAKEAAAKLTLAQWKSLEKVGGLKELDTGIHPMLDEPENESSLKATEQGFEVVTRKHRADTRAMAEEKRRGRFMLHHGFRLKDKLNDMLLRDAEKAKRVAAKLTLYDWQAIDLAGGLRKP